MARDLRNVMTLLVVVGVATLAWGIDPASSPQPAPGQLRPGQPLTTPQTVAQPGFPPTTMPANPPVFGGQPFGIPEPRVATKPAGADPQGVLWRILQNPNGPHTALFFDPVGQSFAVYHVDPMTGQINLKSVRNLAADLRLPHHNTNSPTPEEVRQMLDDAGAR